ncbi:MAG: radical SAM protein [Candidatus Diapherotrites archaeon]
MAKIVLVETAKLIPGEKPRGQAPLGLMLAADALCKNGHEVKIIDGFIEAPFARRKVEGKIAGLREYGFGNGELLKQIIAEKPDTIGITHTLLAEQGIKAELVHMIKAALPHVPVIMGGVAASCNARGILGFGTESEKIEGVDIIVLGRGIGLAEETTVALANLLPKKGVLAEVEYFGALSRIRGIAYVGENGAFVQTPLPALDLRNYKYSYNRQFLKRANGSAPDAYSELNNPHAGPTPFPPATEISTSNGCPFNCEFCHIKEFHEQLCGSHGKTAKFWDRLPMPKIFEEISKIRSERYNTISFEDDNFFGFMPEHREDGIKILGFCREQGFRCIQFPNGLTISSLLADGCKALHCLGELAKEGILVRFAIPVESGSDDTLRNYIRKPHSVEMVVQLLEEMNNAGYLSLPNFQPEAFFVFGNVNGKGKIEPLRNMLESGKFLFLVAEKYHIPISVFGCVPAPPGVHYRKFVEHQEKTNGKVNWHEMLFTQAAELDGKEGEVKQINELIDGARKELELRGLLHGRRAT